MKKLLVVAPLMLVASVGFMGKSKAPAKVRVADFSPDSPAVDVLVDGKPQFSGISFQTITPTKEIANGKVHVMVVPAGQKEQILADLVVKLKGDKTYTLVINGLAKNKDVRLMELTDEQKVDKSKAKVRFVHLSSDTPKVEVKDAKGEVLFKGVEFRKASGYEKVTPGDYNLDLVEKVKKDKKDKKEAKEAKEAKVITTFKDLTFEAGKNYTVFAFGELKDKSLTSVYVVDAGESVSTTTEAATPEVTAAPAPTTKPATTQKAAKGHKAGKSDKSKKKK